MLIYGVRKAHLTTVELPDTICSTCDTEGNATLSVYRKHFHLFWIPMFPVGKAGEYQCDHCSQVLSHKEFPADIKEDYNILKQKTKGPIWQFAGSVLLIGLIALIFMISNQNTEQELGYLAAPAAGDIYEYKTGDGMYSTFKTVDILEDTLFIIYNEYEINKITKLHTIDKTENYVVHDDSLFPITRASLKKMYDDDEIIGINRAE